MKLHLRAEAISFVTQYKFCRDIIGNPKKGIRAALKAQGLKDWRFDFALKDRIAIECEGGIWTGKGHVGGAIYEDNCLKYNTALIHGWSVLRFTHDQIKSGLAIALVKKLIEVKKNAIIK